MDDIICDKDKIIILIKLIKKLRIIEKKYYNIINI